MALTKSDIPDLLVPGLKADFAEAYRTELDSSIGDRIATVISTTMPAQKYGWLGTVPPMREFLDERQPSGLAEYAITIEDKVFEASLAVDRRAIEDDQLDMIRMKVRDLAFRVVAHRQQMVVESLATGSTGVGYDGQPLLSTAHPIQGGSTYANKTTSALDSTTLSAAINAMMLVPDDQGTPLGILPDTLVVGPKLQWTAAELVQSPVVIYKGNASDTSSSTPYLNAFQGRVNVVVSPFLRDTYDDYWFLLDTKRPIKGIILQQRSDVPVEFTALEDPNATESAWMRDRFYYGVRGRYNVGYGLWQTVYGGIL
jgi:phage major head subunit gpT-like protein